MAGHGSPPAKDTGNHPNRKVDQDQARFDAAFAQRGQSFSHPSIGIEADAQYAATVRRRANEQGYRD